MTEKNAVHFFWACALWWNSRTHVWPGKSAHGAWVRFTHALYVTHKRMVRLRCHDDRIHLSSKSLKPTESILIVFKKTRYSAVRSVTRVRAGKFGVKISAGSRDVIFSERTRPTLVPTQPPVQWENEVVSPEVNRPRRESMDSSSRRIDFRKEWSYTSNLPIKLHGICKENLTFTQALNQDRLWEWKNKHWKLLEFDFKKTFSSALAN
jgi:hypothetical protein